MSLILCPRPLAFGQRRPVHGGIITLANEAALGDGVVPTLLIDLDRNDVNPPSLPSPALDAAPSAPEAAWRQQLVFGGAFWRELQKFAPIDEIHLNPFQLGSLHEASGCLQYTALVLLKQAVGLAAAHGVGGASHAQSHLVPLWHAIKTARTTALRGTKDPLMGGGLTAGDAAKLWHLALTESLLLCKLAAEGGAASRNPKLPLVSHYAYLGKGLEALRQDAAPEVVAAWRQSAEDERASLRRQHQDLEPIFAHLDGRSNPAAPAGEAADEVQELLGLRQKLSRSAIASLEAEPEGMQKIALAVESLLANEKVFVCDLERPREVHSLLNRLTNADRVPERSSYEALLLLRDAYDRIDVFNSIAQRNKLRSKLSYTSLLLLNLLVIVWNAISPALPIDGDGGSNSSGVAGALPVGSPQGISGHVVLGLSVANTFAAGVITLLNPIVKWKSLRASAMALESEVFAYRTRTGQYAPPPGMLSEQADRAAERLLAERIRAASDDVFDKSTVADTAFFAKHVLSSGGGSRRQHDPSSDAEETTVLVRRSRLQQLRSYVRRCMPGGRSAKIDPWAAGGSTAFGSIAPIEAGGADAPPQREMGPWPSRDDYHTPLPSSSYVRFRLRPAIDFCQGRLPVRYCYNMLAQLMLLVTSATSVVLATLGLSPYVSIAAGLASFVTAYVEFSEWSRKVRRYSGVVRRLSNLLVWWNELSDTEKALVSNVTRLVGETEATLMFAIDAWADTTAQTNAVGAATGNKDAAKEKEREQEQDGTRRQLPEEGRP